VLADHRRRIVWYRYGPHHLEAIICRRCHVTLSDPFDNKTVTE
jgi:hypothetical protein